MYLSIVHYWNSATGYGALEININGRGIFLKVAFYLDTISKENAFQLYMLNKYNCLSLFMNAFTWIFLCTF